MERYIIDNDITQTVNDAINSTKNISDAYVSAGSTNLLVISQKNENNKLAMLSFTINHIILDIIRFFHYLSYLARIFHTMNL